MIWDRSEDACHRLVDTFAQQMKNELDENFFKGDREAWENWSIDEAFGEIRYHLEKLEMAFEEKNKERIIEHAADVGNCCMIFLDVMGYIEPAPEKKEPAPSVAKNAYSGDYSYSYS